MPEALNATGAARLTADDLLAAEQPVDGAGPDHASGSADALPAELSATLSGLHRAVRRSVRQDLGLQPLSGAQIELLRLVAEQPGIGVSAAARALHLAGNSVSTLVNQLAAAGYLSRGTSPEDRRAAVLTATAAGIERLERWADRRIALFTEQLDRLGAADRAALAAALPALRRLAAGLEPRAGAHAPTSPERSGDQL